MKLRTQWILFIVWLFIAVHGYAIVWSYNLDYFPQFPASFARFVSAVTGMDNSEDIEIFTTYYMLIGSFVIVLPATLLGMLVWKGLRWWCTKRKTII